MGSPYFDVNLYALRSSKDNDSERDMRQSIDSQPFQIKVLQMEADKNS